MSILDSFFKTAALVKCSYFSDIEMKELSEVSTKWMMNVTQISVRLISLK